MSGKWVQKIALTAAVLVLLPACVPIAKNLQEPAAPTPSVEKKETVLPDITLAEARVRMNSEIDQLVTFVDESTWGEPYAGPIPAWSAMWCDADQTGYVNEDAGITLPGGVDFLVKRSTDLESVLEMIARAYEVKPGWKVDRGRDEDDHLSIEMSASDEFLFDVNYFASGEFPDMWYFSVSSWSPCIPVPEDYNPDKEY